MIERIKKLCGSHYITLSTLEARLGFSKSSITKWDVSKPSVDKVEKVADYFGVSVDYLLGRTDNPEVNEAGHGTLEVEEAE